MNFIGIDLEGVLIPEIWVSLAEKTGINELKLTTKDISDYKELMKIRIDILKKKQIKFVKLPVSAPFHCPLMKKATDEMKQIIIDTKFEDPNIDIISNVTAKPQKKSEEIKNLLIEQIEQPVRWRESINNMIGLGVNKFIEIGPGKVLSGLIKRIDRNVKLNQVNNLSDLENIKND